MHPKLKEAYALLLNHDIYVIESGLHVLEETAMNKKINNKVPNPGSDEAIAIGCKCPVMDNCHGQGYLVAGSGAFCIHSNCPIHGGEIDEDKTKTEER